MFKFLILSLYALYLLNLCCCTSLLFASKGNTTLVLCLYYCLINVLFLCDIDYILIL